MAVWDAVVVGSGPNGLTAAVTLAGAGRSVLVLEANDTVGGGLRSGPLTEPGYVHDHCSAIHPLAVSSPVFARLPLALHGVEWIHPPIPVAHPVGRGSTAVVVRDLDETVHNLGAGGARYRRLVEPVVHRWPEVVEQVLGPVRLPARPLRLAPFGLRALVPAAVGARWLRHPAAAGAWASFAGHSFLPLSHPLTGAFGTVLAASVHAVGWPVVRGGTQRLADALVAILHADHGRVRTGAPVARWADLPPHRVVLFDTNPAQVADLAGDRLPARYGARLRRYRHGPGAFKVDYTLDGPVPWTDEACRRAGTVHVGGTWQEVAGAEAAVRAGRHPDRPFVLVGQQSVADDGRAPAGRHTLWAYTHVPAGSPVDVTGAIEDQLERFAPGFRDLVRTRHRTGPAQFERSNRNFVGGDIAGGANDGLQALLRPVATRCPYTTPNPSILLCSASTPPGSGVHGMAGYHAAQVALAGPLR